MTRPDPTLEPWDVDPAGYPDRGSEPERLSYLVRYAVLAPSGHNTQPWRFRIDDDGLEIVADRSRGLPVVDPDDRELTISCGAALGTLEHAARGLGADLAVDVLPDDPAGDVVARVRIVGTLVPTPADHRRLEAITRRMTNRQAFEPTPVDEPLVDAFRQAAATRGCWLAAVSDDATKTALADLVGTGDRAQMADRRFRRELASWVRSNTSARPDGIRGYGFGFSDLMSRAGPFVIRTFDLGGGQAAKDRALATGAPLVVVLGTDDDTVEDWVGTGRALVSVLLEARASGVWASFLNQPIEVAELRPRVAAAVGRTGAHPQLLLRMGLGPAPKPEPRRSAAAVLGA